MKAVARRWERAPRWLRWTLFLPLGLAGAYLLDATFHGVCDAVGVQRRNDSVAGLMRIHVAKFLAAWSMTTLPAVLSPAPWAVAVVAFVIGTLLSSIAVLHHLFSRFPIADIVYSSGAMGVDVAGGVTGLITVRHLVRLGAGRSGAGLPPDEA